MATAPFRLSIIRRTFARENPINRFALLFIAVCDKKFTLTHIFHGKHIALADLHKVGRDLHHLNAVAGG